MHLLLFTKDLDYRKHRSSTYECKEDTCVLLWYCISDPKRCSFKIQRDTHSRSKETPIQDLKKHPFKIQRDAHSRDCATTAALSYLLFFYTIYNNGLFKDGFWVVVAFHRKTSFTIIFKRSIFVESKKTVWCIPVTTFLSITSQR